MNEWREGGWERESNQERERERNGARQAITNTMKPLNNLCVHHWAAKHRAVNIFFYLFEFEVYWSETSDLVLDYLFYFKYEKKKWETIKDHAETFKWIGHMQNTRIHVCNEITTLLISNIDSNKELMVIT